MEIKFIVGTMGSGKSQYIIENHKLLKEKYGSVAVFKHGEHDEYGSFIKSRKYDDVKLPCGMVLDATKTAEKEVNCVIIDEFQFFNPGNLIETIEMLEKKSCKMLILSGLEFNTLGQEWESFTALKDYLKERGVDFEIIDAKQAKCTEDEFCTCPARYQLIKSETIKEHLSEYGYIEFCKLKIEDYHIACEEHRKKILQSIEYTKLLEKLDPSTRTAREEKEKTMSFQEKLDTKKSKSNIDLGNESQTI